MIRPAALLTALILALAVPAAEARERKSAAAAALPGLELAVATAKQMRAKGQRVWCVPFARNLSGIDIRGNAKTWWEGAKGRYRRGDDPKVGAVMVFSGSKKMPMGHVAVVSAIVDERVILIDHANWKKNQISLGMAVVDVSEAGDWSAVRVEGDPGVVGRVNPVSGFIYPGEMVASN
jgi:hypothetical protein